MDHTTDDVKLAYLAGVFDSEGHAGIDRNGGLNVGVEMCDPEAVMEFQARFGGKIVFRPDHNSYVWRVRSMADVTEVLDTLLPFLKVKQRRALHIVNSIKSAAHFDTPLATYTTSKGARERQVA
jgi:hypothetical protein